MGDNRDMTSDALLISAVDIARAAATEASCRRNRR